MFARALTALFFCFMAPFALAQDRGEAMFGLRWDMSANEARAAGAVLTPRQTDGHLTVFRATAVPKGFSDAEFYVLIFWKDRLVKMTMATRDFTDDPHGTMGKERFAKIRALLVEKYGKPGTDVQDAGRKLYREPDEFYQCLNYKGCGLWMSIFEPPGKNISLELKGTKRGVGYVEITTEANPQWSEALQQRRAASGRSDAGAL